MKKYSVALLVVLALCTPIVASCGSAVCPALPYLPNTNHTLEITTDWELINQDKVYVGSNQSSVGAIAQHHDEVETLNRRFIMNLFYKWSDRWSFQAELPYIWRTHQHVHNHRGQKLYDSWDISGQGDMALGLNYSLLNQVDSGTQLILQTGIKLPTGKTNLVNDNNEEAELPIQPGTGSTDYRLGLLYQKYITTAENFDGQFVKIPVQIGLSYNLAGVGKDQWRFGNTLIANIQTTYPATQKLLISGGLLIKNQRASDTGSTREPGQNTGGTWVYFAPKLTYRLTQNWDIHGTAQLPLTQYLNGIQLTSGWNIQIGLSVGS